VARLKPVPTRRLKPAPTFDMTMGPPTSAPAFKNR
jgi:hypothetical protein